MTPLSELYFFEVDFADMAKELRPALFSGVHGFNAKNENALGLDFSGTQMRVFGNKPCLQSFFEQPRTQRLLALCASFKSPAKVKVTDKGVRLTRHRPASRTQPSRLRRFAQRNPSVELQDVKRISSDLVVPVCSDSTKQEFLLKLRRSSASPSSEVRFNAYGLCAEGTALPLF